MWLKILGVALAILVGGWMASVAGLSAHDRRTQTELIDLIENELGPASGKDVMEAFIQTHTERWGVDDRTHHQYAGIREQSWLDRLLFNRMVRIVLRFDPVTEKYVQPLVEVFYIFL